jgi:hypothetical protein
MSAIHHLGVRRSCLARQSAGQPRSVAVSGKPQAIAELDLEELQAIDTPRAYGR